MVSFMPSVVLRPTASSEAVSGLSCVSNRQAKLLWPHISQPKAHISRLSHPLMITIDYYIYLVLSLKQSLTSRYQYWRTRENILLAVHSIPKASIKAERRDTPSIRRVLSCFDEWSWSSVSSNS